MTTKQLSGLFSPDGSQYITLTDGNGNLVSVGGGSGTVTSVSVTTANGVSGSVATPTTTPAISITLGAITPTSATIGAGSAITSSGPGGALASGAYASAYTLPAATSSTLGGVKPDGTTITNSTGAVSVTYGTTSSTAAQGNDSRITGAVQSGGALGTPSSGVATNLTGTASGLIAGNVITNANLTGPITSVGNATSIASQTGTGSKFVVDTSPTLVTPNIGTPTSGALTSCTGLPISTGVSGLGTGVATALGIATNFTGGPLVAVTGPTSWTPTDQSGAGLTFTAVSAQYCQYGNLVFAYGTFTYPTTVDATNAKISLPVAVPNQTYAAVNSTVIQNTTAAVLLRTIQNSSTAALVNNAGVGQTNVSLSTKQINFMLIYPAS